MDNVTATALTEAIDKSTIAILRLANVIETMQQTTKQMLTEGLQFVENPSTEVE